MSPGPRFPGTRQRDPGDTVPEADPCSEPVTQVSTNHARPCLTSVIERELVFSRRYDAKRGHGYLKTVLFQIQTLKKRFTILRTVRYFRSDRPFCEKLRMNLTLTKNVKRIFLSFFGIIIGKRGMGERRHEIDAYLLDNRNRTQKWDE